MRVEKVERGVSWRLGERLWHLYNESFREVNQLTPLAQSFPKKTFRGFMRSPLVYKFILWEEDKAVGLGLMTNRLELEPLLSLPYFQQRYGKDKVYYVLAAVVAQSHRGTKAMLRLALAMMNSVPSDAHLLFANSECVNGALPSLAQYVSRGQGEGIILDRQAVRLFSRGG
ncbi:hypothetical protein KBB60_00225 [Patescibacteria group bacterium]|nr:hypothetical protein [Patescibacteria group bacterium]